MSLGIKLLWRIRPRIVTSPALPGRPPTRPRATLSELLPWPPPPPPPTRPCHGSRHATTSAAAPRPDAGHDDPRAVTAARPPTARKIHNFDAQATPAILRLEALIKDAPDTCVVADEAGSIDTTTTRVPVQMESVMDKVVGRYPAQRETASSYSRHMRKKHGKLRVETRQAEHGGRISDWRLVLKMLRKHARPATWDTLSNSRTIWVGEGIVDTLLHEPDHTLWDIGLRTECVLTLSTEGGGLDASGGRLVKLRLRGSDEAMEAAKAEVSRLTSSALIDSAHAPQVLAPDTVAPTQGGGGGGGGGRGATALASAAAAAKTQWTSSKPTDRPSFTPAYRCLTRFEDMARPDKWTTRSLEAYVLRVIKATHPSHVAAELYGSGMGARLAAVALLQRVLASDEAAPALSVQSVKLALSFIGRAGPSCRPQARAVVARATAARLALDTTVFNVLLAGNARAHDLENFRDILHHMTVRGLAPNFDTWTLFLSMIEDVRVKQHVFRAMADLGLLHGLLGRRALAGEFVLFDLEQERARWRGLGPFLARQDQKYGPRWLTRPTANRLMDGLGRLGKFEACVEFLDMLTAARLADVATLNILLNHAGQYRSTALAIVALHRAQSAGVSLDSDSYHELFKLFRLLRKANCMSLVWRVACLKGHTTFRMRGHVSALYRTYPALLAAPGNAAASSTAPHPVFRRHAKPEAAYHLWRDLPDFHHPDMVAELTEAGEASGAAAGERSRPDALGPAISDLYRKLWPRGTWRTARPLYALLADADRADRELEALGKARRERAQLAAVSSGSLDEWSEAVTNPDRRASPGVPLLLHQQRDEDAPEKAAGSISVVADLTPTIYSRTFGVPDDGDEAPLPNAGDA